MAEHVSSYQFAAYRQPNDRRNLHYDLIFRQQPKQSRMCGIGEKADRRPIDPPPIIQLKVVDLAEKSQEKSGFLQNPYFFMYASLVSEDCSKELHLLPDGKTRTTTGSMVSSLYHLKDADNTDAAFFVFSDISVRMEGRYRLKLSLFEFFGNEVHHCRSIYSDVFTVYSAKKFPGMEESTFLSRSFADQGLKIRIRKETRVRRRLSKRKETEGIEGMENTHPHKRNRKHSRSDEDSDETDGLDSISPIVSARSFSPSQNCDPVEPFRPERLSTPPLPHKLHPQSPISSHYPSLSPTLRPLPFPTVSERPYLLPPILPSSHERRYFSRNASDTSLPLPWTPYPPLHSMHTPLANLPRTPFPRTPSLSTQTNPTTRENLHPSSEYQLMSPARQLPNFFPSSSSLFPSSLDSSTEYRLSSALNPSMSQPGRFNLPPLRPQLLHQNSTRRVPESTPWVGMDQHTKSQFSDISQNQSTAEAESLKLPPLKPP
ncbi:uncharacterized protein VTP21DRAFT_11072 [Calcarisporiella thermophila]|uniref:uncharacterized protein n=1 Tax=Calcarisporiella thermophila TaxID=911321 RepID=UPI003741F9E5